MFCKNCGSEMNGSFCTKCGAPAYQPTGNESTGDKQQTETQQEQSAYNPIPPTPQPLPAPKKKNGCLKAFLIGIGSIVALVIILFLILVASAVNDFFAFLFVFFAVAVPVCVVAFIVQVIRKKKKLGFAIAAIVCVIGSVASMFAGSSDYVESMTPEERAAYEAQLAEEQAQKEAEKAAEEAEKAAQKAAEESSKAAEEAAEASSKAAEEAAESSRAAEEEASRIAEEEAKKAEEERLEQERIAEEEAERIAEEQAKQENESQILSMEDIAKNAIDVSYKDLIRTPEQYIGKYLLVTVEIYQIMEPGFFETTTYFFGRTDESGYGWYLDDDYCFVDKRLDDDTKLLEDDVLKIYGKFVGTETFMRSLTGKTTEMPQIEMLYVEILE